VTRAIEAQSKRLVWPWLDDRAPLLADWLRLIGHAGVEQRRPDSRNCARKPIRISCHGDSLAVG
jgi:hypothetical protein